eukprot:m.1664568 g.1664568  ORF g.1664568 m.1664568 type:complete len:52 (-) comp139504_c0_seq1:150-305(-)
MRDRVVTAEIFTSYIVVVASDSFAMPMLCQVLCLQMHANALVHGCMQCASL